MVKYGNSHFNVFIQDKDLQESILIQNPVSSNFHEIKRIDGFYLIYKKIQKKKLNVMGPLGKLWHALEQANKESQSLTYSVPD